MASQPVAAVCSCLQGGMWCTFMVMPLPARERPLMVTGGRFLGATAIALRRWAMALARASRACTRTGRAPIKCCRGDRHLAEHPGHAPRL